MPIYMMGFDCAVQSVFAVVEMPRAGEWSENQSARCLVDVSLLWP
jgi:hypothetical protein